MHADETGVPQARPRPVWSHGEALAAVPGAPTIDAIVMASAARRGDLVYTSDVADLERLRKYFPSVRRLAA